MDLSTVIQQYQQVVRDAGTAIEQRAEKNAAQMLSMLSPYLAAGEVIPDIKTFILLLVRFFQHQQQELEAADQRHAQELGDDAAAMKARDDAAAALYDELVQIRSEVEATYGATGTAALGMSGITPRQPALLERFASDVLDRLQKKINLGAPVRRRTNFDPGAAADDLAPLCEALRSALNNVAREVAEAKETQDAKNNAIASWEKNVPAAILAAKALFALANDQDGAARLYTTPSSYRRTPSDSKSSTPE